MHALREIHNKENESNKVENIKIGTIHCVLRDVIAFIYKHKKIQSRYYARITL